MDRFPPGTVSLESKPFVNYSLPSRKLWNLGNMEAGTPRFKIMRLIRLQGPQTTQDIAADLVVSKVAARGHLKALERSGLLQSEQRRGCVGRPALSWQLTAKAIKEVFADRHAYLAVELLQAIRECFGDEGVRRVLTQRALALDGDATEIQNCSCWQDRADALAALRDRQGYMARWISEGDERGKLILNHCPVMSASTACGEICEFEETMLRDLLGPGVRVERVEHAASGDRRCSYDLSTANPTGPMSV